MLQKYAVLAAARLEILAGVLFITALSPICRFAANPEGVGIPLGRLGGIAHFALGIACLPSRPAGPCRSVVPGLFAYNLGATTLFAWVPSAGEDIFFETEQLRSDQGSGNRRAIHIHKGSGERWDGWCGTADERDPQFRAVTVNASDTAV